MQSDSVVNAGPAIFISPTGPNPMMVQVSAMTYLTGLLADVWNMVLSLFSGFQYDLKNVRVPVSYGWGNKSAMLVLSDAKHHNCRVQM